MEISTIGLDLAKSVFQVHVINDAARLSSARRCAARRCCRFSRSCRRVWSAWRHARTSHHWAREILRLGHEVRLMPPAYVKPYVKRGKTDAGDAEAICEAVTRPTMRFVPVKSPEQQAALALHRTRDLLVKQRTQLVNMIRGRSPSSGSRWRAGCTMRWRWPRGWWPARRPKYRRWRSASSLAWRARSVHCRTGSRLEKELLAWHRSERFLPAACDDPRCRRHLGHCAGCLGDRTRALPLGPTVRRFAGADAIAAIERRQGEDGQDLEDGRSLSAAPAGRRHDLARAAGKNSSSLGRSAHRGNA